MAPTIPRPETAMLAGRLEIPRMLNGLWQLADGQNVDINLAKTAEAMVPLVETGLSAFDMADHYGPAELVIGQYQHRLPIKAFTKWCPAENGDKSFENAETAVERALSRMRTKKIDLLQYHVWDYTDDTYLYNISHLGELQRRGKIGLLGLTNVDAAHLELLCESGFDVATNQVSVSVIDRRLITGRLGKVCEKYNVGILAYGTLLGGFVSEKWLDAPEPRDEEGLNESLKKYLRFIRVVGGWEVFQGVLRALKRVAEKHDVEVSAVAMRWVLDHEVVKAVIVGCRLNGESKRYAERNLQIFSFQLDDEDRRIIAEAQRGLRDIPGDCGDEYRRAPFLTAKGNLSDHVKKSEARERVEELVKAGKRVEFRTGSQWEDTAGYCRAVRYGDRIFVSGTTANVPPGVNMGVEAVGGSNARSQTVAVLDIIARSLKALGGEMRDVVRTRVMVKRDEDVQEVSEAHGWAFKCEGIRPANTLTLAELVGKEFLVEIEAEAVVGSGREVVCLP